MSNKPMSDNAYTTWYFGMIHRVNGYQYLRFFLMPYYRDLAGFNSKSEEIKK